MTKIKGLIENVSKKKLEAINNQIKGLYKNDTIKNSFISYLLLNLKKYKNLYTDNLAFDKSNASFEAGNAWGVKDTKNILQEKTDQIFEMRQEIESLKNQLVENKEQVDNDNAKRAKLDAMLVKVELSKEFNDVFVTIDELNKKVAEEQKKYNEYATAQEEKVLKLQQDLYKAKETNNKKEMPEGKKQTGIEADSKQFQQENEILMLKNTIKKSEQKVFFIEKEKKHIEQEKAELLKAHSILEEKCKNSAQNEKDNKGDDYLIEEIKSVSEAFEKVSEMNNKLQQQIAFLNKKNRDLEIKYVENQTKTRYAEKLNESTQNMVKKIDEYIREAMGADNIHKDKIAEIENKLQETSNKLQALMTQHKILKKEFENVENLKEEKIKIIYKQIEEIETTNKKLTEELKRNKVLQITVDAYEKSLKEDTTIVDLHRRLEILNEYVYCSLCKSNIKSYVIDSCMHCFCLDCLEHRLKTRSRNCPKCNQEYTKNSIKRVYF